MTTETVSIAQIGNDLVEHCNTPYDDMIAHDSKIWDKHFAESWTSIEGDGQTFQGRDAVIAKYKEWQKGVTMHSCKTTGPFVGQTGFSVLFDMDVESKNGAFPRMQMQEVANYTVKDGKIVQEEFCYQCQDC
jgi:hypothetical protein